MNSSYTNYKELSQKIADIGFASAVLMWDQEVYMPENSANMRAQQFSTLAGIAHEMGTSKEMGEVLNTLSHDTSLSAIEAKNVSISLDDFNRRKKYTTEFVKEMNKAVADANVAWHKAKTNNDFKSYAPFLKTIVDLKRKECEILGYKNHPYDALLDQYEPGSKTADLEALFKDVRNQLVPFVKQIASAKQNDESFMYKHYNKDKQWNFSIDLLTQMGYDFKCGRQDVSSHPFTTTFAPTDVRVTTRMKEDDLAEVIWSTIHEGGHALYEQGLKEEYYGLPMSEAVSLGIHESQSRLWENNVGRGLSYWKANYSKLQNIFPEQLKEVSAEGFYKAMNVVKPSLIRTSADELTYHFHIMIRFEIEKALIEGSIEVENLPAEWNKKYKEYLNIDVPSDTEGVLQDIHWSHGSLGYFPTYSCGSFYAAQFYAQAKKEIEGLESLIEQGNLKPLLNWLRNKIHQHGRFYTAEELCINITGEKLNFKYFMDYAKAKYAELYSL